MPAQIPPNTTSAEGESDDFHLRCIIDEMVRDGADERTIVRALRAATSSHGLPAPRARRGPRAELRRLVHRVTPRRRAGTRR